ncbi:hypothetical protein ACHAXH_007562 [Discostella pseudostelligera]
MKSIESGIIYVGIPPSGDMNSPFSTSESAQRTIVRSTLRDKFKTGSHAVLAFVIGVLLAFCAWVANQGWTIAALLVFGEFSWSSAWKHILLLIIGSVATTIAFATSFNLIFSSILDEYDDDDKGKDSELSAYRKDVADALHDIGEHGMVAGYIGCMSLFKVLLDKKLIAIGVLKTPNDPFNATMIVGMLMWVLCTKIRDYIKAVKRVNSRQRQDVFVGVPNCAVSADEHDNLI